MITIYTKECCSFCEKALRLLSKRSIPYVEVKLHEDYQFTINYIRENFPSMTTFPIIVDGQTLVGGYNELIDKLIDDQDFGKNLLKE